MSGAGAPAWRSALRREMWQPLVDNAREAVPAPAGVEARLARIEQESAIRDLLHRYAYCYDGNDVEGAISVFHADCVLINPRGSYVGLEAIRRNYQYLATVQRFSFHHLSNIVIRLSPDGRQALSTAYFHVVQVGNSGAADAGDGSYVDRLVFEDDWKIAERRITFNLTYALSVLPDAWPARPEPSRPEGSREWIGPAFLR